MQGLPVFETFSMWNLKELVVNNGRCLQIRTFHIVAILLTPLHIHRDLSSQMIIYFHSLLNTCVCIRSYNDSSPTHNEQSTFVRSSTLLHLNKAVLKYMSSSKMMWDPMRKEGNPACSGCWSQWLLYKGKNSRRGH